MKTLAIVMATISKPALLLLGEHTLDMDVEQKSGLTVSDLVEQFERATGKRFVDDSLLLRRWDEG